MEHVDKKHHFMPGSGLVQTPEERKLQEALSRTKEENDKIALDKALKNKRESIAAQRVELKKQFDVFEKDTKYLDMIQAQGVDWGDPGFILEVFVADFDTGNGLILDPDFYKKFTPYARLLSVSPYNNNSKKDWKPGDIVFLGDGFMNVQVNPHWKQWIEGKQANQQLQGTPPTKYIRKIYSWVVGGQLYTLDKAEYLLDEDYSVINEETIKKFNGPYTFLIDEYEVKLRIKGNPWV